MTKLRINLSKFNQNIETLNKISSKYKFNKIIVTKCLHSDKEILKLLWNNGIKIIADISLNNLKKIESPFEKLLMKLTKSDINESLVCCDYVMTSELYLIEEISKLNLSKKIKVYLTLELGDLREGIELNDLDAIIEKLLTYNNIKIYGIAVNYSCLSGYMPSEKSINAVFHKRDEIFTKTGVFLEVSLGGTVVFDFIDYIGKFDNCSVRFGELLYFGYNTSYNKKIEIFHNIFEVEAEVIEVKNKNTDFDGVFSLNAFGEKSNMILNKGIRKRAVLDLGFVSNICHEIESIEEGIIPLANSHNHFVVDVTDLKRAINIGDMVKFFPRYSLVYYLYGLNDVEIEYK